jgi:hypothetical protein
MTDIASELAASFIASQGWTCILVKPATEEVVVTIESAPAMNRASASGCDAAGRPIA